MLSKTPKFDKTLKKYFSELKFDDNGGQKRICRISGKKFYIRSEDIEFYKKIGVPLPTVSPGESIRNKLGFLNIYNLFFNISAKTGKKIISTYPPQTKYKIWEHSLWSDSDFSQINNVYDQKQSFFQQYKNFQLKIPRPNLFMRNAVNSEYSSDTIDVKNCYFVFDSWNAEDSQFSSYINDSKNCYYTYATIASDICYENNFSDKLYKCFFTEFSSNCLESSFLYDCKDCQNCFMCTNLRHKKYCYKNKQLSKEEYEKKMRKVNLGSIAEVDEYKRQFREIKKRAIHRANQNQKNINCSGDYNVNSKNCHRCLFAADSENLSYVLIARNTHNSVDAIAPIDSDLVYNSMIWDKNCYNVKFSLKSSNLRDSEYCQFCRNCSNCFACIGLKNKQYCIFNKQYTEKEYWQKVDEIKAKMLKDGEYGEFFPAELAPIPYNISIASSFGGYNDIETAKKYGYQVEEIPENIQKTSGEEIDYNRIPDDINDVNDDILKKIIIDKNGKKFRYTKEELKFHRQYNLALPTEHYSTVLARKRVALGPIDFTPRYRHCAKCGKKVQVTFPKDYPGAPKRVYCEECYNREVA